MKFKIRKENGFDMPVTIGFVGHIPLVQLQLLKKAIEGVPDFDLVFFKTSSGRLWIKGDKNGD